MCVYGGVNECRLNNILMQTKHIRNIKSLSPLCHMFMLEELNPKWDKVLNATVRVALHINSNEEDQ